MPQAIPWGFSSCKEEYDFLPFRTLHGVVLDYPTYDKEFLNLHEGMEH